MSFTCYDIHLIPPCITEEWESCDECGANEEDDYINYWDEGGLSLCRRCMATKTRFCRRCGERDWNEHIDDEGVCETCRRKESMPMNWEDQLTDESLGR